MSHITKTGQDAKPPVSMGLGGVWTRLSLDPGKLDRPREPPPRSQDWLYHQNVDLVLTALRIFSLKRLARSFNVRSLDFSMLPQMFQKSLQAK